MHKRIIALAAALLMLRLLAAPVCAQELPDPERTGSLMLWMAYDGEPLDSGNVTLYRVAEVAISDGNAEFRLLEALSDGPELTELDDPQIARQLAQLAQSRGLEAIEESIEMGWVVFAPLEPGLYVVTQSQAQAAEGFDAIQPFLISLPRWEDGAYVYDLTAAPKVPLVPRETEPTEPPPPTEPDPPGDPDLPQTGQLNWPVPVLAVLGMTFFLAGWALCRNSGRKDHAQ
jgi:hypothetical protein